MSIFPASKYEIDDVLVSRSHHVRTWKRGLENKWITEGTVDKKTHEEIIISGKRYCYDSNTWYYDFLVFDTCNKSSWRFDKGSIINRWDEERLFKLFDIKEFKVA